MDADRLGRLVARLSKKMLAMAGHRAACRNGRSIGDLELEGQDGQLPSRLSHGV